MATEGIIQVQTKDEKCPQCGACGITGKRSYCWLDVIVAVALLVLAFPLAIFYLIYLIRKDYEFDCSCGYQWKD